MQKHLNPRSVAINQADIIIHQTNSSFIFRLFKPKGRLSTHVQAVWSSSNETSTSIKRWLQGDACDGIMFNLGSTIYLDDTLYPTGEIVLPVSKQAHSITLPPGSQLAGIRFHPAIGVDILRGNEDKPAAVKDNALQSKLRTISNRLVNTSGNQARIVELYKWLNEVIDFSRVIPQPLLNSMHAMKRTQAIGSVGKDISLSQRQLERLYQKRLGMTPKQYQRIIRVQKTLNILKHSPTTDLVELALNKGFSDQSHMTREFKQIAKITPGKYSKLVARR